MKKNYGLLKWLALLRQHNSMTLWAGHQLGNTTRQKEFTTRILEKQFLPALPVADSQTESFWNMKCFPPSYFRKKKNNYEK